MNDALLRIYLEFLLKESFRIDKRCARLENVLFLLFFINLLITGAAWLYIP